ncbi:ribosome-associated protein [Singulisphaera sp. GP187]|uniref:ribosome silencing factor n=1 Tax=Singulisphaera sp. GP187 TaxID=1882752 RepID=UPI00092B0566|nr:ribosome silencing factor [Singulisphaera sp. GP187]SIN78092.1 ribosome-associated protein [Singulisphaera sp. GP187]
MADINDTEVSPPTNDDQAAPDPELKPRRPDHEPQDDVPFNAAGRSQPDRMARALEHARICARIADDNRAKDIMVLDLRQATPLVDFFVIATASSRRQSNAIATEIDQEMKRLKDFKLGLEGSEEGRWVLVDYGDFVVHVFSGEARTYYGLEDIWGDAPRLDWQDPDRVRPAPRSRGKLETAPEAKAESMPEADLGTGTEAATDQVEETL